MQLDKSPKTIADMFNKLAPRYDLMNDLMTLFVHRKIREIAINFSDFQPNQKALDLATGTGDLVFLLYEKSQGKGKIIGVDISEYMIRIAKIRTKRRLLEANLRFEVADMNHLPFPDSTFDVCTIGYGIRNVENPYTSLKEINRITKFQGKLIIIEATSPDNSYIRFLADFYFTKIVPLIAKLFSSSPVAYNYLGKSIRSFFKPSEFIDIIKMAGWNKVFSIPYLFGTTTIFLATK